MNLLQRLQLEMAVKQQKSILPEYKQLCEVTATQMKMHYDSLVNEGFTEEQAMDLIAFHGIDVGRSSHIDRGGKDDD